MPSPLRVLFLVEGFTDIRFVTGLSEICDLTLAVPARQYRSSELDRRIAASGARILVIEIPGNRLAFQTRSLWFLLRHIRQFHVVLSQEVLRGSLNATLVGALRGVPVVTYMGISPVEYFRCRRERGQIGPLRAAAGEAVIRLLMWVNGRLATHCLAMGPYLREVAVRYCQRTSVGLYYGVDTDLFRPATEAERMDLRQSLGLPAGRFLVLLPSRISHEKDPETVIQAAMIARERGVDVVLLNLGGGWRQFLELGKQLGVPAGADWLMARPAVNPLAGLADYFRTADVVALASLAEGAAFSTLEALAAGTPVVATAVGGMAVQLDGYARLTPRRDAQAMADALLWVAKDPISARAQAARGREYVRREWDRRLAFDQLRRTLETVARKDPVTGTGG
jgi:glycosyltransferase involved in cell wall biosynthesis